MPLQIPFYSRNKSNVQPPDVGFWEDVGNNYARQYKGMYRGYNALFEEFATQEAEEDFEWWNNIEGYEDQIEYLSQAKNISHLEYLKENLNIQREIRAKLERGSIAPAIVAGIFDPLNVALAFPIFNTGLKATWAAKNALGFATESAKIALPFAVTREAIRAPFDPYATPTEVGLNIASETIFAGVFGYGVRKAANGIMRPKIAQAIKNYDDYLFARGKDPTNINGVPVKNKTSTKKRTDGSKVGAYFSKKNNEIVWDKKYIKSQFDKKAWLNPKVVGVKPLPDYLFETPDDWARFVLHHEKMHVEMPFLKLKERFESVNPNTKYTRINYENDINDLAIEDYSKGFGIKETAGTKSFLFNIITTAGKRILNNKNVPNEVKRTYVSLFYNASLNLEGNIAGTAIQSAHARTIPYASKGNELNKTIKRAYVNQLKGSPSPTQFLGVDIDAVNVKLGNYGANAKDYDTWYKNFINFHVDMITDPSFDMALYHALPDLDKKALAAIKTFFNDFETALRASGKLGDDAGKRAKISELQKNVDFHKLEIEKLNKSKLDGSTRKNYITQLQNNLDKEKKQLNDLIAYKDKNHRKMVNREFYNTKTEKRDFGKVRYTMLMFNQDAAPIQRKITTLNIELQKVKGNKNYLGGEEFSAKSVPHQKQIDKLETEIEFLKGDLDNPIRTYAFPHYFNKELLLNDVSARENLTQVIANAYRKKGSKTYWDDNTQKYISKDATDDKISRELAEESVLHILENSELDILVPRSGKSKHLMQRVLDIPTHELKEFLIFDERVIQSYANKMGFHVEFGKKMGSMTIDDVLDRHEYVMRSQGKLNENEIARIRADMLSEYEREAGIHIQNPNKGIIRFGKFQFGNQQKVVRNLKSIAGMTYLPLAGLSALIDAIGMPLFKHGPRNVFNGAMDAINGDFPAMLKMGDQLRDYGGEVLENQLPIVQNRYLSDSVRDIQPKFTERFIQGAEKVFYRANAMSGVTVAGKRLSDALLVPTFYKRIQSIKNNESIIEGGKDVTDSVIEDLSKYGLDIPTIKRLADMPFSMSERGSARVDITEWSMKTQADRDLIQTFMTYRAQHARNTIVHATAFDKPVMMDGFMYVRMNPMLKAMGYTPDKRASTTNVQMVRLESAYFGIPFQFMSFPLAATNKIAMQFFDPNVQHRITGMLSLLGMSYVVLKLKKPDWWFENKDYSEILMRTVDQSGVTGIYMDLAYHALHSALAHGLYNDNNSWIKGKFQPSVYDDLFDKFGAAPSMVREWLLSAYDLTVGNGEEGLKRGLRNLPLIGLYGMNRDIEHMFHTRNY